MKKLKVFKLITSEEIIGLVEESTTKAKRKEWEITDALMVKYVYDSATVEYVLYLTRFDSLSAGDTVIIRDEHILYCNEPKQNISEFYATNIESYKKKEEERKTRKDSKNVAFFESLLKNSPPDGNIN